MQKPPTNALSSYAVRRDPPNSFSSDTLRRAPPYTYHSDAARKVWICYMQRAQSVPWNMDNLFL